MSFAPPAAKSLARPYAQRAVHLLITPRPSNLGESREIHRLLSQFGEIEYFRSLKYDNLSAPNAALVIYKEEQAARDCLKKSPIRFRMGRVKAGRELEREQHELQEQAEHAGGREMVAREQRQPRGPVGGAFGLSSSSPRAQTRGIATSSLPTPPPNRTRMPFDPPPTPSIDGEPRFFQIQTNSSRRNFQHHINVGPFHGPFQIDRQMVGQEDLEKKVPYPGLSCVDWRKVERVWRVVDEERERFGSRMSLGELAREARGEVVRREEREWEGEGVWKGVGVGGGGGNEIDENDRVMKDDFFTPLGGPATEKSASAKDDSSEDVPLQKAMRGWEDFFPDISSSEEVERYSRKRK